MTCREWVVVFVVLVVAGVVLLSRGVWSASECDYGGKVEETATGEALLTWKWFVVGALLGLALLCVYWLLVYLVDKLRKRRD
jgi:hypothetical protein